LTKLDGFEPQKTQRDIDHDQFMEDVEDFLDKDDE